MKNKGYTLIELLVIAGILVLCGALIAGVIFSTLRGGSKSSNTNYVAQNGNYALSRITDYINSSNSVLSSCSGLRSSSVVLNSNIDETITLACQNANIVATITSSTGTQTIDLLNASHVSVTDTSNLSECSFKCYQADLSQVTPGSGIARNPYINPVIVVDFYVRGKELNTAQGRAIDRFTTSVIMRNYTPHILVPSL